MSAEFVVVFTDHTDVSSVVGAFETYEAARQWAINSERVDETWFVKQIERAA
jgi:hypothetical protein